MKRKAIRGFSLIELLVVLAILVILIGLLLPAYVRSRQSAMRVACAAQLQQIGRLLSIYADTNRGVIFAYSGDIGPSDVGPMPKWPRLAVGNAKSDMLKCPSGGDEAISYQMNSWLRFFRVHQRTEERLPHSEIVVVGESYEGFQCLYSAVRTSTPVGEPSYDLRRHGRRLGANHLYLDFHVSNDTIVIRREDRDSWFFLDSE